MSTTETITIASALLAAVVATVVPALAFRFALRQEHTRWLREQRSLLYVDMLMEAIAEKNHFEFETADPEVMDRMRAYYVDLRLPEHERARLGARANSFGSTKINQLFNEQQAIQGRAFMNGIRHEGDRITARVQLAGALENLQAEIRRELGADTISLGRPGRP